MTHPAQLSWNPYQPTSVVVPPLRRSSTAHVVIAWVLAVTTLLYLLPWAIAASRNKDNVVAIALINILLGWSVVGWVAALVMACTGQAPSPVVLVYQPVGSSPSVSAPPYGMPYGQQFSLHPVGSPHTYGNASVQRQWRGASEPTVVLGRDRFRDSSRVEVTRPLPVYADDPQSWRRS